MPIHISTMCWHGTTTTATFHTAASFHSLRWLYTALITSIITVIIMCLHPSALCCWDIYYKSKWLQKSAHLSWDAREGYWGLKVYWKNKVDNKRLKAKVEKTLKNSRLDKPEKVKLLEYICTMKQNYWWQYCTTKGHLMEDQQIRRCDDKMDWCGLNCQRLSN